MQILTLRDESIGGDLLHTIELRVENELMTVRELIAARVRLEVDKYNAATQRAFVPKTRQKIRGRRKTGVCGLGCFSEKPLFYIGQ